MHPLVSLVARILLSAIFIFSGYGKIIGYAGTEAYMQQHGVPGVLLPAVIAVELLGGLAILFGFGRVMPGLLSRFLHWSRQRSFTTILPTRCR